MYSAFGWRAESPGHDELRCVLYLINGTVMEDHFRQQVASTPLGTVRSSLASSADLGENANGHRGAVKSGSHGAHCWAILLSAGKNGPCDTGELVGRRGDDHVDRRS